MVRAKRPVNIMCLEDPQGVNRTEPPEDLQQIATQPCSVEPDLRPHPRVAGLDALSNRSRFIALFALIPLIIKGLTLSAALASIEFLIRRIWIGYGIPSGLKDHNAIIFLMIGVWLCTEGRTVLSAIALICSILL